MKCWFIYVVITHSTFGYHAGQHRTAKTVGGRKLFATDCRETSKVLYIYSKAQNSGSLLTTWTHPEENAQDGAGLERRH